MSHNYCIYRTPISVERTCNIVQCVAIFLVVRDLT